MVELLAAGVVVVVVVVVVAGVQIEAHRLPKVETMVTVRSMTGMNRLGRSARDRWNQMEGTTWV